jgi:hypothetical protein
LEYCIFINYYKNLDIRFTVSMSLIFLVVGLGEYIINVPEQFTYRFLIHCYMLEIYQVVSFTFPLILLWRPLYLCCETTLPHNQKRTELEFMQHPTNNKYVFIGVTDYQCIKFLVLLFRSRRKRHAL